MFDNGAHCEAKNLLKTSAFLQDVEIISPFTNRGDIEGIFLLVKERFDIFQYILDAASGLWRFLFNSLIYFSLPAKIISVHSFDLVNVFSKSVFFYHSYNIFLLNWSALLIYSLQFLFCSLEFLPSTAGPYN